jgi:hypothetical protein
MKREHGQGRPAGDKPGALPALSAAWRTRRTDAECPNPPGAGSWILAP